MEMTGPKALPVLLCGRLERVGSLVIEELKPEYEGMLMAIATAMFSLFDYLRIVKLFILSRVSKTGQPTFL
jgi:hypothetical protein